MKYKLFNIHIGLVPLFTDWGSHAYRVCSILRRMFFNLNLRHNFSLSHKIEFTLTVQLVAI